VTVRFLADEDLDSDIVYGLRRREPAIDILDLKDSDLRGTSDPALLELANQESRILITHDRTTITRYCRERMLAGIPSSGVFVVPQGKLVGDIIESLLLTWSASEAEEWRNQILYLPFK